MQAESSKKNPGLLQAWANDLACPACHGSLRIYEGNVVCSACGRIYSVVDGIPVLIVERAAQKS